MTKEEFNEVLILTDISDPKRMTKSAYGTMEEMYYWQNFTIYFNGKNKTIIEGKIPLEIAQKISENYDMAKYGIYYDPMCHVKELKDNIRDDKFFQNISSYIKKHPDENSHILVKKAKDEQRNVLKRNTEKYICNYYIVTKEGLFIFINEVKKYLALQNGDSLIDLKYFDEEINSYIKTNQRYR